MSDLSKELGAGSLTSDQVDAITHAWLDLCAVKKEYDNIDESMGALESGELAIACRDSIAELEQEFPFLLEGVNE